MADTNKVQMMELPGWMTANSTSDPISGSEFQIAILDYIFTGQADQTEPGGYQYRPFLKVDKGVEHFDGLIEATNTEQRFLSAIQFIETIDLVEAIIRNRIIDVSRGSSFRENELPIFERFNGIFKLMAKVVDPFLESEPESIIESFNENKVHELKQRLALGSPYKGVGRRTARSTYSSWTPDLGHYGRVMELSANQEEAEPELRAAQTRKDFGWIVDALENGQVPKIQGQWDAVGLYEVKAQAENLFGEQQPSRDLWAEAEATCKPYLPPSTFDSVVNGRTIKLATWARHTTGNPPENRPTRRASP